MGNCVFLPILIDPERDYHSIFEIVATLLRKRFHQSRSDITGTRQKVEKKMKLKKSFVCQFIVVLLFSIFLKSCGMTGGELYVSDIQDLNVIKEEWNEMKRDLSVDGNSLIVGEKWYSKGLGVHANSEISLAVPKGYTHFVSEVGVDDEIPEENPGSVVFLLIGDGAILYESPIMRSNMPPRRIHINIEGISELKLIVDEADYGTNSDHADWGNARFVKR